MSRSRRAARRDRGGQLTDGGRAEATFGRRPRGAWSPKGYGSGPADDIVRPLNGPSSTTRTSGHRHPRGRSVGLVPPDDRQGPTSSHERAFLPIPLPRSTTSSDTSAITLRGGDRSGHGDDARNRAWPTLGHCWGPGAGASGSRTPDANPTVRRGRHSDWKLAIDRRRVYLRPLYAGMGGGACGRRGARLGPPSRARRRRPEPVAAGAIAHFQSLSESRHPQQMDRTSDLVEGCQWAATDDSTDHARRSVNAATGTAVRGSTAGQSGRGAILTCRGRRPRDRDGRPSGLIRTSISTTARSRYRRAGHSHGQSRRVRDNRGT